MHTDYCRCFLYFHIYIVLHECVIAFSILYIFRLCDYGCRDDDFFCQCRTCMYRGSVHVCSSTIGVHTRTDPPYRFSRRRVKKRHLNYLFVMTIQLSFRLVLGTLLYHCFLLRSSDWRTYLVPMIWFGAVLLRHVHSYISIKSYSSNCFFVSVWVI